MEFSSQGLKLLCAMIKLVKEISLIDSGFASPEAGRPSHWSLLEI
jgi:hypothetical protein